MRVSAIVMVAFVLLPHATVNAQNQPQVHYNSAFLTALPVYPYGLSGVDWFPYDYEVQGVTNDGKNWFFTITDQEKTHGILWRIPKNVDLGGDVGGNLGVRSTRSSDVAELAENNRWHFGDPDHVSFEGEDYIIVPINSGDNEKAGLSPIVACFRADNLQYVNYATLDKRVYAGWCAVGSDMFLYSSANSPSSVVGYEVDWSRLVHTNAHDVVTYRSNYPLILADGSARLTDMQGGEFTPDGEMLYLVSGRGSCFGEGAPWSPRDGIHAIETLNWREIRRSVKTDDVTIPFRYDYDPTCISCNLYTGGGGTDTPEGLTVWDLDVLDLDRPNAAPNLIGTVHVLVSRYMKSYTCDDRLYFHHFNKHVYVYGADGYGVEELGLPQYPFRTIARALSFYPIWDGAVLRIVGGRYNEKLTLRERVRLEALGGPVRIGDGTTSAAGK